MQRIELKKIKDCAGMLKQTPEACHYDRVVSEDAIFTKNGKDVGLYIKVGSDVLQPIRSVVASTKYIKSSRTRGIATQSSVFGSLPRIARRNDFCRYSSQTKAESGNASEIFSFLVELTGIYKKYLPAQYERDKQVVDRNVLQDYRLNKHEPFTTANINVNHAIKYHRDSGNFKGNLSNVLILRDGIEGGELVFPEYGFALRQADGYLAIFDGQSEIHGCMPIHRTKANPYRASIVYYTLEQMKHCYPFKMEVERLQNLASIRANNRAQNKNPLSK